MSTSEKLIVFVKAPIRGTVKTRLAKTLGDYAALEIYTSLVRTVLNRIASVPGVELRYAPDAACAEIENWCQAGWSLTPQGDGDLGVRIHRAFEDAFETGAKRVVIIGSDCPEVDAGDIGNAWQALNSHDVVLGPADDGGYWLIGLRTPQRCLFEGVHWSTGDVLAETLAQAQASGLSVQQLRTLSDIDTGDDWKAYQNRRATQAPTAP